MMKSGLFSIRNDRKKFEAITKTLRSAAHVRWIIFRKTTKLPFSLFLNNRLEFQGS